MLGIATCSFENLLQNCLMNGLMERFSSSGYIFSQVSVCDFDAGTCDFSQLDIELAHGIDFVCVLGAGRLMDSICGHLSKLRVPFAVLGADTGMRAPQGGSAVPLDYNMAVPGFVGACLSHGIRSVLQVSFSHRMANAVPALRRAGLRAREMFLEDSGRWEDGDVVGAQYMAMDAFDRMLKSGQPLPDLVFFADDHLAAGALTALLANGVRVPQDVSVATWSNRLSRPVFPVSLARMEVDVVAAESVAADAVLAYLKTGVFPSGVAFGPAWVDGASIAVKTADCGKIGKENRHEDN